MVAFHFPPAAMGSGHLRTLGFARYLPELGWEPTVLTAASMAYPRVHAANRRLVPEGCRVRRAAALDVRRHVALGGKYPGFLAQPDGWASWWPAAVWHGLRLIRKHRMDAIWSTYPIMTAHAIAHTLAGMSGLPWVADFRDPVASSVEAGNRYSVAAQARCERRVLARARRIVFTTPGALRGYAGRYPEACGEGRLAMIPNGYDEADFADLPATTARDRSRPLQLLHSGLLYPDGRDPLPFLDALASLRARGCLGAGDVRVVFRASGCEARYAPEIRRRGLADMVILAPPVSSREALYEQAQADALLVFQGRRFNRQIPAKVYEYLRIGRPILAMVGPDGDTAALLETAGGAQRVAMDDRRAIEARLLRFIHALREDSAPRADPGQVHRYSRRHGAGLLAGLFDRVVAEAGR